MPRKTKSYKDWLDAKLANPERAARYLNAAAEDSEAMFLKALRKVAIAQKRSMPEIAQACGVSRESLYRMLSEAGNPTSENRRSILASLGLKSIVVPIDKTRMICSIESEGFRNTLVGGHADSGNTSSGGYLAPSVFWFGMTALPIPTRKGPKRDLGNVDSVGHLFQEAQRTGGSLGRA